MDAYVPEMNRLFMQRSRCEFSASKTPLFSPQIPRLLLRYVTHILNASNNNGLCQSWDTISGRCTGEQTDTMAVSEHPLTLRFIGQSRDRNFALERLTHPLNASLPLSCCLAANNWCSADIMQAPLQEVKMRPLQSSLNMYIYL